MIGLLPYLDPILKLAGQSSPDNGGGKINGNNIVFWLEIGLGILSYLMVLSGLTIYMINTYNPSLALCVIGLVTLSSMLILVVAHKTYLHLRRKKVQKTLKEISNEISNISEELMEKVEDSAKDHAVLLASIAAIAGYAVSRKVF